MTHKTSKDPSRYTVRALRARRARLARHVPDLQAVLRGSLLIQRRRCGKPGCRCTRGELHGPYVYLAVRAGRRNRLLYIPAELAQAVQRCVQLTGRVEARSEEHTSELQSHLTIVCRLLLEIKN